MHCIGAWQKSNTKSIEGELNKTGQTFLIGECQEGNRKESLPVTNNTKGAEVLAVFSKTQDNFLRLLQQKTSNLTKNPGRALEIGARMVAPLQVEIPSHFF